MVKNQLAQLQREILCSPQGTQFNLPLLSAKCFFVGKK